MSVMSVQPEAFPSTLRGELRVLVMYDTPDDKLRERLADACLNQGLYRVQQSCYLACIKISAAKALQAQLQALAFSPLKRGAPKPKEPRARITVMRLDQGALWTSLHMPSPVTQLTPPHIALQPKGPQAYLITALHQGAPVKRVHKAPKAPSSTP